MSFPRERPRRLRTRPGLRRLVRETRLGVEDLVLPLFVQEGITEPHPIDALPGHAQHSLDSLVLEVESALALGLRSVILFGLPVDKDPQGSQAWHDEGIVQQALRRLREAFGPDPLLIADLCLC